jgi:hypothetical protein
MLGVPGLMGCAFAVPTANTAAANSNPIVLRMVAPLCCRCQIADRNTSVRVPWIWGLLASMHW